MDTAAEALPKIRLFVRSDLASGGSVDLAEAQGHYLLRVMRQEPGAGVRLFNGRDGEWLGRIERGHRAAATVSLEARLRPQEDEDGPWLAFAPVKKSPTDFIVEKATELGAARICIVMTKRTIVRRVNTDRLEAVAVEAAEQCGRLTVPWITVPVPLHDLAAGWPPDRPLLVADPHASPRARPLAEVLHALARLSPSSPPPLLPAFVVGPEGGLTEGELDVLAGLPCAKVVRLGARTLRAETAALALLACWQAAGGDWR